MNNSRGTGDTDLIDPAIGLAVRAEHLCNLNRIESERWRGARCRRWCPRSTGSKTRSPINIAVLSPVCLNATQDPSATLGRIVTAPTVT